MLSCDGKNLVTPRLLQPVLVHENERVVGKEPLSTVDGRYYLGFLHEFQCQRMCAEKRLDRPWVRLAGIGGNSGFLQSEKVLTGANHEAVMRKRDNIGSPAAGKIKANRHSTRAGVRRVIGSGRVGRGIREANGYGHRRPAKKSVFRESRRIFRGHERSLAYDAFGVSNTIAGFGPPLHHGVEDLLGEALAGCRSSTCFLAIR